MRIYLNTEAAIVCGGDLVRNMPPGEITRDGLRAVFAEDRILAVAEVTPKKLRAILEAGVSHITLNESEKIDVPASMYGGFPQISGFVFEFDATAPAGSRVREIRIDGNAISLDDETTGISLAATEFMLKGGYGLPPVDIYKASEQTLVSVVSEYIADGMDDYLSTENRIHTLGAREELLAILPSGIVIAVMAVILVGHSLKYRNLEKRVKTEKK